jgi:hypothetical protein
MLVAGAVRFVKSDYFKAKALFIVYIEHFIEKDIIFYVVENTQPKDQPL